MGGPPRLDLTGNVYGRLTALNRVPNNPGSRNGRWRCLCECGEVTIVGLANLRQAKTLSCGCLRSELVAGKNRQNRTHGHTVNLRPSPTYSSWLSMWGRCTDRTNASFKNYGARGITVCQRWESFENFLTDMGERPEDKTLDRKDNDKNYTKDNCHWASPLEQTRNRRKRS